VDPKKAAASPSQEQAEDKPLLLSRVLREEYEALRPEWREELNSVPVVAAATPEEQEEKEKKELQRLFEILHRKSAASSGKPGGLAALCLSGGGIRSATFNLGTMQGLARAGVLDKFDYLSSVSGGGFIAGWLAGWIYRAKGLANLLPDLLPRQDPAEPEAEPVVHLRQYSNYLTPRVGALSADFWAGIAIVLRNLILNWLVLVPVLAAALAVPLLAVAQLPELWVDHPFGLYVTGLVLGGISLFFMSLLRAHAREPKYARQNPKWSDRFLLLGLAPLLAATPLILEAAAHAGTLDLGQRLGLCFLWSLAVPIIALVASVLAQRRFFGHRQSSLGWDLLALVLAGIVEMLLYATVLGWVPGLVASPYPLFSVLGPTLFLLPLLLGKTLFIGFANISEKGDRSVNLGDADREWWARWSAWELISALVWTAGAGLVLFAPTLLRSVVGETTALVGTGGLGALISLLGKSSKTKGNDDTKTTSWLDVILSIAPLLFCAFLIVLLSFWTQRLLWWASGDSMPDPIKKGVIWLVPPFQGDWCFVLLAILALFGAGLFMGLFVNANRFSLQALYRNRLVRAYLGASHTHRRPNLFTGFDIHDNILLHKLKGNRPLPLINMTLNLVSGQDLAWQQRKAESFTATPLHCGNYHLGYRRADAYGGSKGMSLGTAMATSGAVANPNMGFYSSAPVTFIMALFNTRLGIWLGNPGKPGQDTYQKSGPTEAVRVLVAEALGFTDDTHPYVNLSDGGQFEDLGIYEAVRRRCQTIVVCDAGGDPECTFGDLGNAIRKIRIDMGISIDFGDRIHIFPKNLTGEPNHKGRYCAIGTVHYGDVDGAGAKDGTIVYVKPAITGEEPYDVYNYARSSTLFPHESTADQWFNETQFESYRALGETAISAMAGKADIGNLEAFITAARDYVKGKAGGTAAASE